MRMHRLISILLLVEARGKVKAKELASRLETSSRTIYRDIDTLCEAGIPLATTTGPDGGIQFMDGYSIGISDISGEDIINLYLSGIGIQPDSKSDMSIKLKNALLKLEKSASSKYSDNIKKLNKSFYFDHAPWWGEHNPLQNVDILVKAVFQSKKLIITYKKVNGEISVRKIHPYGIVVKRMDWYLAAYCEKSGEIRSFKCERIIESQIIDESFYGPQDFSIEEYWNKSSLAFKNNCRENEYYPVIIRVDKAKAEVLDTLQITDIKENESFIEATVNMYHYNYATENIMSIIAWAEVMEPLEVRNAVEEKLYAIIAKYKI